MDEDFIKENSMDYEVLDGKFVLDYNRDRDSFNFYIDKFRYSPSFYHLLNSIKYTVLFFLCQMIVMSIFLEIDSFNTDVYIIYKNFLVKYGVIILSIISVVWFIIFLFEFLIKKPNFRLNKLTSIYITDGFGLYVASYDSLHKSFSEEVSSTQMVEKIIETFKNKKLDSESFSSVIYLDNYNIVYQSSSSIILDIPSDSHTHDELRDVEITSSVRGFRELKGYIGFTEGGYYD